LSYDITSKQESLNIHISAKTHETLIQRRLMAFLVHTVLNDKCTFSRFFQR